jgi:hypothetical protein
MPKACFCALKLSHVSRKTLVNGLPDWDRFMITNFTPVMSRLPIHNLVAPIDGLEGLHRTNYILLTKNPIHFNAGSGSGAVRDADRHIKDMLRPSETNQLGDQLRMWFSQCPKAQQHPGGSCHDSAANQNIAVRCPTRSGNSKFPMIRVSDEVAIPPVVLI